MRDFVDRNEGKEFDPLVDRKRSHEFRNHFDPSKTTMENLAILPDSAFGRNNRAD
jgi:hypothetical protein